MQILLTTVLTTFVVIAGTNSVQGAPYTRTPTGPPSEVLGQSYYENLIKNLSTPNYPEEGVVEEEEEGPKKWAKIIGGVSTTAKEWYVQIRWRGYTNAYPFCGGALIGDKWVLTAAHCIDAFSADSLEAWVGSTNSYGTTGSSQGEVRYIKNIIVHENFSPFPNMANDIGLLELDSPIYTKQKALLSSSSSSKQSDNLVVMGTGVLVEGGTTAADTVRKVVLPYVAEGECEYNLGMQIASNSFCAGVLTGGKDACQGDSGGSLYTSDERTIVGVVSYGIGCARVDKPGVYSDVYGFKSWILGKTGTLNVGPSPQCIGYEDGYSCDDGDSSTINDQCINSICQGSPAITSCISDSQCIANNGRAECQASGSCVNGQCLFALEPVGTTCPYGYCDKRGKCSHIAVEGYGQVKEPSFNVIWMHAYGIDINNCKADLYKIDWSVGSPLASFDNRESVDIRCTAIEGINNDKVQIHIDVPSNMANEVGANIVLINPNRNVWSDPQGLKFVAECQATNSCPTPSIDNYGWGCEDGRCLWMVGKNFAAACSFVIHHPTWSNQPAGEDPVPLDTIYGNCDGTSATIRIPDWIYDSYIGINILLNINNSVWSAPMYIEF